MRRWLGFLVLSIGFCSLAPREAVAQSGYLQPGDVAVTCVDTTGQDFNTDRIQITPLIALPAVTNLDYRLEYTAYEADQSGDFDLENPQNTDYIDLGGARAAGESVLDVLSGHLTGPNEQVFLFQGFLDDSAGAGTVALSPGVLLWGFQMSLDGGWASTPGDGVSALPTVLASASTAVKSTGDAVWAYVGPTTGTRAVLQVAIGDPTNWMVGATCPTGFVVTDGADGGGVGDASHDVFDAGADARGDTAASDVAEIDARDGGDSGVDQVTLIDAGSGAGGISGAGGASGAGGTTGTGGVVDAGSSTGAGGIMGIGGAGGAAGGMTGSADAGTGGSADAMVDAQALDASVDAKLSVMPPISSGCNCAVSNSGAPGPAASLGFLTLLGLLRRRRRNRRLPAATDRRSDRTDGRGE
jgi:MYXO-CTERM domain-containing protein